MNPNQRNLLKKISVSSFVLNDTILFLDTHPCCQEALDYYHKAQKIYNDSLADYQKLYGPLINTDVSSQNEWSWVNTPWPWEGV